MQHKCQSISWMWSFRALSGVFWWKQARRFPPAFTHSWAKLTAAGSIFTFRLIPNCILELQLSQASASFHKTNLQFNISGFYISLWLKWLYSQILSTAVTMSSFCFSARLRKQITGIITGKNKLWRKSKLVQWVLQQFPRQYIAIADCFVVSI